MAKKITRNKAKTPSGKAAKGSSKSKTRPKSVGKSAANTTAKGRAEPKLKKPAKSAKAALKKNSPSKPKKKATTSPMTSAAKTKASKPSNKKPNAKTKAHKPAPQSASPAQSKPKAAPKKRTAKPPKQPTPQTPGPTAAVQPPPTPQIAQQAPAATGGSVRQNEPLTVEQLRKVKTGLVKRDLDRFRRILLIKRAEIVGDVTFMQSDVCNKHDDGTLSHMPVHMADLGSDNYEQEFTLGLMESGRQLLREIDEALQRLADGTYGVCIEMGVPIGKQRLEVKPWAKYCVEAAREMERRKRP